MKNYYELLEVNENASEEVISRVYKLLAKKYHPDMNLDNKEEAEEMFKKITEAYEILSDENKRKDYDLKLSKERQQAKTNNTSNSTNTNTSYTSQNTSNFRQDTSIDEDDIYVQMVRESEAKAQNNLENQINEIVRKHDEAIGQAYNDAYVTALKNMGVKVVYEKTFKEKIQSLIRILLTIVVLACIIYFVINIPAVKLKINEIYESIPFLKKFIEGLNNRGGLNENII